MKDWVLLLVGLKGLLSCIWSPNGLSGIRLLVSLNLDCNLGTLLNLERGLCASYILSYPLTRTNLLVDTVKYVCTLLCPGNRYSDTLLVSYLKSGNL